MAICEYCGEDMLKVHTCVRIPITHNGVDYEPIKFGDEERMLDLPPELMKYIDSEEAVCADCNVKKGGYHHPGCDNEECPICGLQLISCGCVDEQMEE